MSTPPLRILVPIDLSERCADVVRWALDHAGEAGEVTVVHALLELAPNDPGVVWGRTDDDKRRTKATAAVQGWLDSHGLTGPAVRIGIGPPASRITQLATDLGVELIAMPAHQRRPKGPFSLGSVAERVIRTAPCPVWVARGPAA